MTNALYTKWKQALVQQAQTFKTLDVNDGGVNNPYCALVTIGAGAYVYSAAHQYYSDIGGTNIQGTPQPILAPTLTPGSTGVVFDGGDCTYIPVFGTSVGGLIIYRHNSGANTTWRLVYYYDTTGFGLPVTPNGGNVIVSWNPSGIFLW